MESDSGKENIAEGLIAPEVTKDDSTSPLKPNKKSRSLSLGPGALKTALKEDSGNRRKSAFVPAVKSILSGKDDEAKRREERRKTLANRRVSFAPEATLHTWDVIEYLRDATTSSSASSESTRRASSVAQTPADQTPSHDAVSSPGLPEEIAQMPSTPPDQMNGSTAQILSMNQRQLYQKKKRPGPGVAAVSPSTPDSAASSTASEESSPSPNKQDEDDDSSDESEDTAMSLDNGDATGQSIESADSGSSTSSSARLDEALRQAAVHAGTQGIDFDENGDASMEMADDEITAAFKPWVQKGKRDSLGPQKLSTVHNNDQENIFSPALKARAVSRLSGRIEPEGDDTQEMSMDMTRSIGGIVKQNATATGLQEQKNLKRRRSSANFVNAVNAEGSPAKRQSLSRRSSLRNRRSVGEDMNRDDETMDFTMVVGGIQSGSPAKDLNKRQSMDTSFGEETMEFTMVVGGIKEDQKQPTTSSTTEEVDEEVNEDMSMELTATLDKTIKVNAPTVAALKSPARSPAKSPRTPTRAASTTATPTKPSTPGAQSKSVSPQKASRKSPRKSLAPVSISKEASKSSTGHSASRSPAFNLSQLPPERLIDLGSPQIPSLPDVIPSPTMRHRNEAIPASPVRDNKIQFSPLPKSPQRPTVKAPTLSESIKLLSTPRKQATVSPTKRPTMGTPKKAVTPKKAPTPKRATPRKQVRLDAAYQEVDEDVSKEGDMAEQGDDVERITLQEFLNLTNIRFMDLTTTKRRHTGHPGTTAAQMEDDEDKPMEEPNLENNVAVALAVLPMLSMYQHSCHEMKNYISGGREEIRSLEAEAYETQPPLFREYLSAPVEERAIMEGQFKNMKTNARLQSKAGWHAWRAQLLNDLMTGLQHSARELEMDEKRLTEQEAALDAVLPDLIAREEELSKQVEQLQRRAAEMDSVDREELENTRARLVATEKEIEEKQVLLTELEKELAEKDAIIEAAKETKAEYAAEINEAERVREECRGWSVGEVEAARDKLQALEQQHGWSLTAASDSGGVTLCYRNDLSLFLHPGAFCNGGSEAPNSPISLSYVGSDSAASNTRPRPLTTTKRFFLQLLRAHVHGAVQSQTAVAALLQAIAAGWGAALAVAEAVRRLEQVCVADEAILSDERLAVDAFVVLANLKTKVRARFVVEVGGGCDDLVAAVRVEAKVCYGERYDEAKMGEFLSQYVGSGLRAVDKMGCWADGVEDLKGRLLKRGKKGERI